MCERERGYRCGGTERQECVRERTQEWEREDTGVEETEGECERE